MSLNIKKELLLFALVLIQYFVMAQVGNGTTTPNSSSILHIENTNQGVLVPRLAIVKRKGILNPVNSLFIFNQNTSGVPACTTVSTNLLSVVNTRLYNINSNNRLINNTFKNVFGFMYTYKNNDVMGKNSINNITKYALNNIDMEMYI